MDDPTSDIEAYLASVPALVSVVPVAKALRSPIGLGVYVESVAILTTCVGLRYCQVTVDLADVASSQPGDQTAMDSMLQLTQGWTISDDAATPYRGHGGGQGGGRERLTWMNVVWEPAPLPEATTITLTYGDQVVVVDLTTAVPTS